MAIENGPVKQKIREGIAAFKAGNRVAARLSLQLALSLDPQNTTALLWLAYLSENFDERISFFNKILVLNPKNERAKKGVRWAEKQRGGDVSSFFSDKTSPIVPVSQKKRKLWPIIVLLVLTAAFLLTTIVMARVGRNPVQSSAEQKSNIIVMVVETFTPTPLSIATEAALPAPTETATSIPPTAIPSNTPSPMPTATTQAVPTATQTQIPAPTATNTASATPILPTETSMPTATTQAVPTATQTQVPAPTATDTASATPTLPVEVASQTPAPTAPPAPPTPVPSPTPIYATQKWIEVDLSDQSVVAWEGNVAVMRFIVSTGLPGTPTVVGSFHIYQKLVSTRMVGPGYDLPNVPHTMYFYLGYALHGAYWHNNFGHPMSHGCVNLALPDAERLFNWATPVLPAGAWSVYATADNPGSLVVVHY